MILVNKPRKAKCGIRLTEKQIGTSHQVVKQL